jgi:hypothetical protein
VGLVVTAGKPVTKVSLSGTACGESTYRCLPEKFDNQIHGDCRQLQVKAMAEGTCIVELTVGGDVVRIEKEMVLSSCQCYEKYYVATKHGGTIDLRTVPDAAILD